MTEQTTIIPELTGEKIVKRLKRQAKDKKLILAVMILGFVLIGGYATGYISGYHQALIDFKIIAGSVFTV